jgi:flagellar basal-body rod protein FlgF
MLKGIYTAAAGMLATNIAIDTLASNLANVNTVGFKGNRLSYQTFPEMILNKIENNEKTAIGSLVNGSKIYGSYVDYAAGGTQQTGNPLDMAIHGDGFFHVKGEDGKSYYTRAGNFTVNASGDVVTPSGEYLQGKSGNIHLNMADGPVTINSNGTISAKGQNVDQVVLTHFQNNQALEKLSDNLYQTTSTSQESTTDTGKSSSIQQGALEQSNVNPVSELVNNIQGMRLYEALQKNIHMQNDALGKTVNDVGRYK